MDVSGIEHTGTEHTGTEHTGTEHTGTEHMEEDSSTTNTNPNITTITPPDSLTQLAQTISTELMNAFQDIAPSQHGDITIEYGILTDPNYVNRDVSNTNVSHTDVSYTDVSNEHVTRGYYDTVD